MSDGDGQKPWVDDDNAALLIDLYELTMVQAYWREEMFEPATFDLYYRTLPHHRGYMLACGLDTALRFIERLRFTPESLAYLATFPEFTPPFLDWLAELRFTGDVFAVPEGTPIFPDEPLIEVVAPLPEAQLLETFLMNQIHFQTVVASKAARVVEAAAGRPVIDFGLRRMHGADAGLKAARAFAIAGVEATSNVLAGSVYGVKVVGTMAHSYIQAHDNEFEAFSAFAELYPETVLLVDTYDTLLGIDRVIDLAQRLRSAFKVRAVRLDSGDLGALAKEARQRLDAAGLERVEIFVSGGLDEFQIAELVAQGAPIDGFGVGTQMGVSRDAPDFDLVYKLVEYAGEGRMKLSPDKVLMPGRKQVYRWEIGDRAMGDVVCFADEERSERPLMQQVMAGGERLAAGRVTLAEARACAQREIARLPANLRALEPQLGMFEILFSEELSDYASRLHFFIERDL